MAHAEQMVVINRPIQDVYNFVLDGSKNMFWRPSVTDVQVMTGGAGAVFKQGLKGPGGRRMDGDYQIVETNPPNFIKFEVIAGPARPTGTYEFDMVSNGTQVKFALDYQTKGLQKLMEPMINRAMREEVGCLTNLKAYLESKTN